MALTTDQKASKLFKKLQGTSETTTLKQFFEEAYLGRVSVFHTEQIWNQSELIPITAPVLVDAQIDGVIQYFENKVLTAVPGLTNSFFHADLKDTIPFNFSDGSYNYTVTDSTGTLIPFGMGDWLVDTEAGVLTFYSSVPANMPPRISFYKYVGTKGAGSGAATGGSEIFVIDVTNASSGIVGNKLYVPNTVPIDRVVTEATTDDDSVEIHFMVEGGLLYSPTVTVGGITCTNLQQYANDQRLFFGSVILSTITVTTTVDLVASSGGTTSVIINRAPAGPNILSVNFANGYPGTQTEVKENDLYDIEIHFDPLGTEPVYLEIFDFGACKFAYIDLTGSGLIWGTVHTATVSSTIDLTSIVATPLPCRVRSHNLLGTWGNTVDSDASGNVDGFNEVLCNDITPTFRFNNTNFPATQAAFKGTEVGSNDINVYDFDNLTYSSPNGDFSIALPNAYIQNKSITCTNPGHYNDSVANYRIDAHRNANDTDNTYQSNIEVADINPIMTVTQPQTRLRTSPAGSDYLITSTSDQNMFGPIDHDIPVSGTWQGVGFVGGMKVWTRTIQLIDGDIAGISNWGWNGGAPTNRANLPVLVVIGQENVGGFESRIVNLAPFGTSVFVGVECADTSKLTLLWSFKNGMVFQPIGTPASVANGWTIDALNVNPTEFIILDTAATNASSQTSYLTIEEII